MGAPCLPLGCVVAGAGAAAPLPLPAACVRIPEGDPPPVQAGAKALAGFPGETITEAGDGGTWAPDGKSIYYVELDESHRPYRVRRHVLGTADTAEYRASMAAAV